MNFKKLKATVVEEEEEDGEKAEEDADGFGRERLVRLNRQNQDAPSVLKNAWMLVSI